MKTLTLIPIAALALCATLAYAGGNTDTSSTASDSNAAMTSDAVGGTSVGGNARTRRFGSVRYCSVGVRATEIISGGGR
ncbi:hypothetical protein [Paraburkholderia sp. RL17-337-BIB-A]|uniref:hypothetical protein n=1 Tax=Paraburkholderia sp. RL17-337-BIB-A TaxID=3031636 RepID=UPI0038B9C56C